ncbi:MAG: beta-ketoacyl-[acyl-carrier-protein] synthase family protein [Armatimonadetes bacterium]|nr:beta-ketoacyl-[acyl-carrier-protein] synthase family protein [Armatimonadota bacterium]
MAQPVVITGVGLVSPLGCDVGEFWRRLIAGERGLSRIERFDPTGLRNERAGEVKSWVFEAADFGLDSVPSLASQFALVAAAHALLDAGYSWPLDSGAVRVGAVASTNFAGADYWEQFLRSLAAGDPKGQLFAGAVFDETPRLMRKVFGLRGPAGLISIACSSGAAAIGLGADWVRWGLCDVAVAGGHDCLAPSPLAGLSALHTITADDIHPFSANRSGTIFGEGAAYVVLESLDAALERGAKIYAEVAGWAQNNNGYHMTAPDPGAEGMTQVIAACLANAAISPDEVDYINAHGTGTQPHDPAETLAIKNVLGKRAYEIPVSSIKGAIGHLMGAAGAIETVAASLAIVRGIVPPTASYTLPDPECDLDYVPNVGRPADVRVALSISAGIGGSNACVALRRVE